MSRYLKCNTLKSPFTLVERNENDDIISTIAYYSLQDQGFIPSSIDDMNDEIYSLLCGEAKVHIMKHEFTLYAMMNEWNSKKQEYWEQCRVIRDEQDKNYAEAVLVDTPRIVEKYIFRTDSSRVVIELSSLDPYTKVMEVIGNKFTLSSPGTDTISVKNINSSLCDLSIIPGIVYHVE